MRCINIKHKDFIKLLEDSKLPSLVLEVKIAKWQEENNSDEFPSLEQLISPGEVNFTLKVIDKVLQNLSKVKQWEKQIVTPPVFWEKLQKDLGIPKEQIQLLKESSGNTIEEKLTSLVANYSYTVEVNTAKKKSLINQKGIELEQSGNRWVVLNHQTGIPKYFDSEKAAEEYIRKDVKEENTDYYSNLTVPGGTNYTENEIATPAITPSIKGHAQFATPNGIGWFRSDESQQYQETDIQSIIDNLQKSGQLEINCK